MLINPLIPLIIGTIFFIAYLNESNKGERADQLFMWIFFFIALAMFIPTFFLNTNLISATTTGLTTIYTYGPDPTLQSLGYVFGGVEVALCILIVVRFIWTRIRKAFG